jgi:NADPH-dependent curcumin reductase CurA
VGTGADVTTNRTNRRLLLRRVPAGALEPDDVEIVEEPVEACGEGQVLLQRVWLAMESPIRLLTAADVDDQRTVDAGMIVRSGGLGRVVESRHPDFEPGIWAGGLRGWEEWSLLDGDSALVTRWPRTTDPLFQLAVLNGPGPTAYFGLTDLGRLAEGDTVLVTHAEGPTGSLAVQIALNLKASVIGVAGTDEGRRWVDGLGVEACLDRTTTDIDTAIRDLRPRGLDIVFDSAGGELLDVGLRHIGDGARVVISGADVAGTVDPAPGPPNYLNLITRGATMSGLKGLDFVARYPEAQRILREWYQDDRLRYRVDVAEGLESCVDQFNKTLTGSPTGTPMVMVSPDPGPGPY